MKTVTIKFKANGKEHKKTFLWRGPDCCFEQIKQIYKDLGVKRATRQMLTISSWGFWVGYAV